MFSGLDREDEEEDEEEVVDGVTEEEETVLEASGTPESEPGPTVHSTRGPGAELPSGTGSGLIALLSWAARLPRGCWDCAGPGNGGTNSEGGVAV